MDNPLKGKVVIITGASSGIGAATARILAHEGCRLVLASRSADKLNVLAAELGKDALAVPTDMSEPSGIKEMVAQAIKRFGRVDALFANAGIYVPGEFAGSRPEAWAEMLRINIDGVLNCIHAVLPYMQAQKSGDIVVTSSISGYEDIHWEPVYSASKHAVQGFVHSLRRQVAAAGIRVGSVAPGIVLNELWGVTDKAEIDRRVGEKAGLRSEDVARAVLFILSQPAHVTIRDLVILPQNQDI